MHLCVSTLPSIYCPGPHLMRVTLAAGAIWKFLRELHTGAEMHSLFIWDGESAYSVSSLVSTHLISDP